MQSAPGLILPTMVTLITYTLLNELWFGTATPVSEQAKALGAHGVNWKPLEGFLKSPVFLGHSFWLGLVAFVTVPLASHRHGGANPLGLGDLHVALLSSSSPKP